MTRRIRLAELLLATEGAALLRQVLEGDDDFVAARLAQMRHHFEDLSGDESPGLTVPELDVAAGYASWAATYDSMSNALIRAEEPLVRAATHDLPIGSALDAACGTGRHAAWLSAAGHATVGIDATPEMLEVARQRVPTAEFRLGDFTALDTSDDSFDFAICALALTHLPDPSPAIVELARVVRPGGRIVLTDAHPTFVLIQGQALFPTRDGFAFVRNYPHLHSTYLRAFARAGLVVRECFEAPMETDFSHGLFAGAADAAAALWDGIPVALVWSLERPLRVR